MYDFSNYICSPVYGNILTLPLKANDTKKLKKNRLMFVMYQNLATFFEKYKNKYKKLIL